MPYPVSGHSRWSPEPWAQIQYSPLSKTPPEEHGWNGRVLVFLTSLPKQGLVKKEGLWVTPGQPVSLGPVCSSTF